jgi:predicted nucleotidyltransferase
MLQEKSYGSVQILSINYKILLEELRRIARTIKKTDSAVKKIFLFGSFAQGNYTPESDIDLLIIIEDTDVPFLFRRDKYIGFYMSIPFDMNILVYTQREIDNLTIDKNKFISEALTNSVEL